MLRRLDPWFQSLAVARRFVPELRGRGWTFALLAALSLAVIAADLLRPWPIQWILDHALDPEDDARLSPRRIVWLAAATTLAIVVTKAATQYLREVGMAKLELWLTRRLRHRLFAHLTTLSPVFHARHKSGDLLVRLMGDAPMVSTMLVTAAIEIATRLVFVVGTVIVMWTIDPALTAVTFVVAPLILLVVRWVSKHIHVAVRKQRVKEGDLADHVHEAIAATETIQALGGSDEVVHRFARNNRRSARAGLKAKRLAARLSASVESLIGVGIAIVLAVGAFRVLDDAAQPDHPEPFTAGLLIVFLSYVRTLAKPVRSATKQSAKIAKGTACGERLLAILDAAPDVRSEPGARPAPEAPGELAFENVTFRYDGENAALDRFSAGFRRGELSALVGRSGAGKSTIASLAMRLMDPAEGRVTLDGAALSELELDSVRGRVGLCLQRTMLFGESIRENLVLGAPEASDEAIWRALEMAQADGFVRELDGGLDAELGSSGAGLSGGQLSRLSLARTLLRNACVLIVDEPFAGLDRVATRHVGETLRRLSRDRIVVVIAHDFENIAQYDHIVFLDEGRKVDEGTHEELAARLPSYREVVRTTAGAAP